MIIDLSFFFIPPLPRSQKRLASFQHDLIHSHNDRPWTRGVYLQEEIYNNIFIHNCSSKRRIIHIYTHVRCKPCSWDLHRRPSMNNLIAQWKRQLRRRYSSGRRWRSGHVSVITLATQLNSTDDFVCDTVKRVCTNLAPLVEYMDLKQCSRRERIRGLKYGFRCF